MKENSHKDLARYRMEKAHRNLSIARESFYLGFYDEAITKSYYAVLTAMRALLALFHVDSKRHEGLITLFHKHFVAKRFFPRNFSRTIRNLKKLREDADYGDFVEISKENALKEIENAEAFLKTAEKVVVDILTEKK